MCILDVVEDWHFLMRIDPCFICREERCREWPAHEFNKLITILAEAFDDLLILKKNVSNRLASICKVFDLVNRYTKRLSYLNNRRLNHDCCWFQDVRLARNLETLQHLSLGSLDHAVVAELALTVFAFENGAISVVFASLTEFGNVTIRFV